MKIVKEFVLREIAGEAILVPTGATSQEFNGMISLSATAQFIWENMENVNSLDEMVKRILDEFEVDEETARNDAFHFIAELIRQGIAEPTREDMGW